MSAFSLTRKDVQDLCKSPDTLSAKQARNKLMESITNGTSKNAEEVRNMFLEIGKSQASFESFFPPEGCATRPIPKSRNAVDGSKAHGVSMDLRKEQALEKSNSLLVEEQKNSSSDRTLLHFDHDCTSLSKKQSRRLRKIDCCKGDFIFDPCSSKEEVEVIHTSKNKGSSLLVDFPARLSKPENGKLKNNTRVPVCDLPRGTDLQLVEANERTKSRTFPNFDDLKAQMQSAFDNFVVENDSHNHRILQETIEVPELNEDENKFNEAYKVRSNIPQKYGFSTATRHLSYHDVLATSTPGLPVPTPQHRKGIKSLTNNLNLKFDTQIAAEKQNSSVNESVASSGYPILNAHFDALGSKQDRKYFCKSQKGKQSENLRSKMFERAGSRLMPTEQCKQQTYVARTA